MMFSHDVWPNGGGCVFSQWGRWGKTSVQTSSNRFLKTLSERAIERRKPGAYYSISQPSPKRPTLSFGGGSPLNPRRAGGRKKVWINIQKTLEYLEGDNQVSPKSPPLQGMKAQPLQSLFIGKVDTGQFPAW